MSNVIKAYSVRYDDGSKKTINMNLKKVQELEKPPSTKLRAIKTQEGFVEGLQALIVDELPSSEEANEKTSGIIEEAKKEAKDILDQAKQEAEQIKKEYLAQAQKKGYEEGMLKVKQEAQRLKAELDEKSRLLEEEYEKALIDLEPKMAEIIAELVEKITGVVVEDKEDIILYLIHKAMKNMDKAKEFSIRVSKEDYEYVASKKDYIMDAIGSEAKIFVTEDVSLKKNQCLIETELQAINCSLDIQLKNLIRDLKLIGNI